MTTGEQVAPTRPYLADEEARTAMAGIRAQLIAEAEYIPPSIAVQFNAAPIYSALRAHCEARGLSLVEYMRHSARFRSLPRERLFDPSRQVTIPEGPANLVWNGNRRRQEEGYLLDLAYVREQVINPAYVLFFRATQPMQPGGPKPEYFWTTDALETIYGLGVELGDSATTAIVLASSLEDIVRPAGLMNDINDDNGIAVRQVDLGPYNQNRALFSFPRQGEPQTT